MPNKVSQSQALGATGLNLIRIAIAAYFIAVSLDWAEGFSKGVLFQMLTTPDIASFIGSMVLFYLAFVYLCGFQLRMSALFLAVFVLSSSFVDAFVVNQSSTISLSHMWRDLAFVCAILLSYASLSRRDMRHMSVVRQKVQARGLPVNRLIRPSRMASSKREPVTPKHPTKPEKQTVHRAPEPQAAPQVAKTVDLDDPNPNIFADV